MSNPEQQFQPIDLPEEQEAVEVSADDAESVKGGLFPSSTNTTSLKRIYPDIYKIPGPPAPQIPTPFPNMVQG